MTPLVDPHTADFADAVQGLLAGDFSRLEPLFREDSGGAHRPRIIEWCEQDLFRDQPGALAEALTCACFLDSTTVAEDLLRRGVDPAAGAATGLNALHWAVNRGQREAMRLLLSYDAPLESRNRFGGTVLGTAIWSALNEPRPAHFEIIEELLRAGANVAAVPVATGHAAVDELLRRYRET